MKRKGDMQIIDKRNFTGVMIEPSGFGWAYYHYFNGKLHRDDGPAIETLDGNRKSWLQYGKLHRDGGPALIDLDAQIEEWYQNGLLHREDGPATVSPMLVKYYQKGKLHRTDGPAQIRYCANGTSIITYCIKGELIASGFEKEKKKEKLSIKNQELWDKYFNESATAYLNSKDLTKKQALACDLIMAEFNIKFDENGTLVWKGLYQEIPRSSILKSKVNKDYLPNTPKIVNSGSRCQKCNEFNEYVNEKDYTCYSCKNL